MEKKILGLDLGSASIGWALISEITDKESAKCSIIDFGSRIIPYEGTEGKDFAKGTGETKNSLRTTARTARKGYDRYQLRRKYLSELLAKHGMQPDEMLFTIPKLNLWQLRSKAAIEQISINEFGRILLWLNQKRGYKSSRSDTNKDKKDTDYVANVKSRHQKINELNLTIGQYFYLELQKNEYFRVKDNIFPREAYIEEFDKICKKQQEYYPELINNELIKKIKNEIIYFQRPLKSQKGLVSICEFEGFYKKSGDGKEYFVGPRVSPKSSPLFQTAKIWESINNVKISDFKGNEVVISLDQKKLLFDYLDNHEKLTQTELFKILSLKKENYIVGKQVVNGIQGNITKCQILNCFENPELFLQLTQFNLKPEQVPELINGVNPKTGEIKEKIQINPIVENEPFYKLWHVIYSIDNLEECSNAIHQKFLLPLSESKKSGDGLPKYPALSDEKLKEIANRLAGLDFKKFGFTNKSAKVLRKILPYLMEGDKYSEAMSFAGYDHSHSITKDENLLRPVLEKLKPIEKNSLRQPIVEKILNQMINLVNAVIDKYGKPDEIRIELARELKQSKEERSKAEKDINQRNRENEFISKRLAEYGLRATRNNILKWRLYEEINNQDKKLNAICIYCGQPISLLEAIKGHDVDIEHIIPKSRLFDDSQSNKTLAHRHCNKNKNDRTAFDFMKSKSDQELQDYIIRVNDLYTRRVIKKSKRDKLLMTESKIPDDFITRQLRESQYIARKAREILQTVCRHVWSTSGSITAELRRLWGWDDITMNLQLPKYKELGLTEWVEWETNNGEQKHKKEVISGWTKRDDHRHHAIDALTIACTKQGFIQRFNTLNSTKTREDIYVEIQNRSIQYNDKLSNIEKYIISQQPIPTEIVQQAVSKILISFKAGKKVAILGKRKIGKHGNKTVVQSGIVVPRGPLSEASIYGKINRLEIQKLKYLFENPDHIFKPYIKKLVTDRLELFEFDIKKALASVKKDPIYLNKNNSTILEYASCFREEFVIKYAVNTDFTKTEKVIDKKIKAILEARLAKFGNKPKEAFKDVLNNENTPIKWYEDEGISRPIKSVRCYTGLSEVVPLKMDNNGKVRGYVKPGNNHHIAIYRDQEGNMSEHVCTFWHAVERKKHKFPVVIQNTNEIWDKILSAPEGTYTQDFIEKLPGADLNQIISIQMNEMFILGMSNDEIEQAMQNRKFEEISLKLYRVQKLGSKDYTFRHHLETQLIDDDNSVKCQRFIRIRSIGSFYSFNPQKVRVDLLGGIRKIENI